MPKKLIIFLLILGLISAAIIYLSSKQKGDCLRLTCLSMNTLNQYRLKDLYEEGRNSYRALYKNGDDRLRVEVRSQTSLEEAQNYIQTQITRIKGVFEVAAAPYPGEVTNEIVCAEEFKPIYSTKTQSGIPISYFSGFLNQRMVMGSCTADQLTYHNVVAMFYCPNQKQFFQIELIVPKDIFEKQTEKYQKTVDSITCKNR